MAGKKVSGVAGKIYLALICLFLYMPILTLVVLSFNATKTRGRFAGFSLRWYRSLFHQSILHALFTTLLIALISALAATVFGTIVAFAMNHMKKWKKTTLMSLTEYSYAECGYCDRNLVDAVIYRSELHYGIFQRTDSTSTFNLPFVVLSVAPRLGSMNTSAFEAAQDLGASKAYAFWKVIFPDIMPNILTGFLLSFTMSVDDFVITHFTKGVGDLSTLSTVIYTEQKKGIRPEIYSLSASLFVTIFVLLILYTLHKSHAEKIKIRASSRMEAASRWISLSLVPVVFLVVLFGYYSTKTTSTGSLKVYNWGKYDGSPGAGTV